MEQDYVNQPYAATNNTNVFITITIGNAQIGGSAVIKGAATLATGQITNLDLGSGQTLKGSKVLAITTVSDINQNTNNLVVTYTVTGGGHNYNATRTLTVANNGDAGRFTLVLTFS